MFGRERGKFRLVDVGGEMEASLYVAPLSLENNRYLTPRDLPKGFHWLDVFSHSPSVIGQLLKSLQNCVTFSSAWT